MTTDDHPGRAWLYAVDNDADFESPHPPPIDSLADAIREDGSLDELPALALLDEIHRLRKVLRDAAQSLTTLSTAGARNSDSGLDDMIDVRGYASSRAKVAWAALGEARAAIDKAPA